MKRWVFISFLVVSVSAAPLQAATDTAAIPATQPIGVFTNDNGTTIVVGIGTTKPLATLDVSRGEVKIGSTGAPCRATLAGTLRYADKMLQLCDGTSWRNVSLDKAQ